MTIQGSVVQVIYFNEQNNYTVVDIDYSGELITAVGIFPALTEGEMLSIEGEFQVNPRFGRQFKANSVTFIEPNTIQDIVSFLSSGLIKGVGERKAKAIVDIFGEKSLQVIETEPMQLLKVAGIGKKTAQEIADSYAENKLMKDIIMYLQHFNITTNLAIKIFKAYKNNARTVIEQNPYKMIDDIDGVGFKIADRIAFEMGVERDSNLRIRAGIVYVLGERCSQNGNSCIPKQMLLDATQEILEIEDGSKINDILDKMLITGEVKQYDTEDEILVAKDVYYYSEYGVAERLIRLYNGASLLHINIDEDIKQYEFVNNITLHPSQKEAIKNAVCNGIEIITGGPGTGKTTIIKAILTILKTKGQRVALCAPTGRAAKRLSDATGEVAKTIHRLLNLNFNGTQAGFLFNENNKLPFDTIIVDEISMVDIMLFNALLKALDEGTRLILVGDKDQLPSVSPGNVLKDIINSNIFAVDCLSHIYRQDENSLIITNAHKINSGEMPKITNKAKDFFFEEHLTAEDNLETTLNLCCKRLPNYLGVSPKDIQVLAPIKKGLDGVNNLNKELQKLVNPPTFNKKEIIYGATVFREGDKVMQVVNNYQLKWETTGDDGVGVFNGDIGEIVAINNKDRQITVRFEDDRRAVYNEEEFEQLMLSYAISIHKSQGSEFDVLVICISNGGYVMLNRNLLYTAVTRAKKMVVIIGSTKHLYRMVKNDEVATRYSLLRYFLADLINGKNIQA